MAVCLRVRNDSLVNSAFGSPAAFNGIEKESPSAEGLSFLRLPVGAVKTYCLDQRRFFLFDVNLEAVPGVVNDDNFAF